MLVSEVVRNQDQNHEAPGKPMNVLAQTDERLAFHEAGHAVLAHLSPALRLKTSGNVSIISTSHEAGGADVEVDCANSAEFPPARFDFEFGVVSAAGMAADVKRCKERGESFSDEAFRSLQLGAAADLRSIRERFGSGLFAEFFDIATARLESEETWNKVTMLAAALVEKRMILVPDVISLIK